MIDSAALRRGQSTDQGSLPAATMRAINTLDVIMTTMSSNSQNAGPAASLQGEAVCVGGRLKKVVATAVWVALAISSAPAGAASVKPPGVKAPNPFLPWEMITAGNANPTALAAWVLSLRVLTVKLPSEQRAKDDWAGVGIGAVQAGFWGEGKVLLNVPTPNPSAKMGETQ